MGDILRFITSQKLGYVRPSTLLKRLNSYAKKHPLHKALRDLGRLYKTDLILRIIDDIQLRASIEGMLSKVERSNKFSNAVTLFDWPTQSERDTASGCRMLIMNVINYYNLLYLSDKLRQCKTEVEREELLGARLHSYEISHQARLDGFSKS